MLIPKLSRDIFCFLYQLQRAESLWSVKRISHCGLPLDLNSTRRCRIATRSRLQLKQHTRPSTSGSRPIRPLSKQGGGQNAAPPSMVLDAHENEQQEDYLWGV
jgi:hypothetical protein